MAKGRMIVNAIAGDKRVNQLSDDTSRLAFTWLITFADCEGRTHGDPAMVRSLVFPRRDDISLKQMEGYIREWAACGLVIWYEAEDDRWIYFPAFDKNQAGMDRRKEQPSRIPDPPSETHANGKVQSKSVLSTDEVQTEYRQSTVEENRIEENITAQKNAPDDSVDKKHEPTAQQAMFGALEQVCVLNGKIQTQAKNIGKTASQLVQTGYDPQDVLLWYSAGGWWYRHDWRGKQGQPPKPAQVSETIEQAKQDAPKARSPATKKRVKIVDFATQETRELEINV